MWSPHRGARTLGMPSAVGVTCPSAAAREGAQPVVPLGGAVPYTGGELSADATPWVRECATPLALGGPLSGTPCMSVVLEAGPPCELLVRWR